MTSSSSSSEHPVNIEVIVQDGDFDPAALITARESGMTAGSFGARVDFTGHLRDFNDDRRVHQMFLEHYPGMTEHQLRLVCEEAARRWALCGILVAHRVGEIAVADTIVLVSVWSIHRADAFDACRFIINELKTRAPFWKREFSDQGEHWVSGNTIDEGV